MPVEVGRSCINIHSSGLQHQLKTPSKESEDDLHSCKDEVINEEGCVISEKHVYKDRCSQCSLAFKTSEKLEAHLQYHMIRDASKCRLCERSFRTVPALLKHLESSHSPGEELSQYRLSLMSNPLLMAAADTLENISSDSRVDNGTSRDSADVNESITKEQMVSLAQISHWSKLCHHGYCPECSYSHWWVSRNAKIEEACKNQQNSGMKIFCEIFVIFSFHMKIIFFLFSRL